MGVHVHETKASRSLPTELSLRSLSAPLNMIYTIYRLYNTYITKLYYIHYIQWRWVTCTTCVQLEVSKQVTSELRQVIPKQNRIRADVISLQIKMIYSQDKFCARFITTEKNRG